MYPDGSAKPRADATSRRAPSLDELTRFDPAFTDAARAQLMLAAAAVDDWLAEHPGDIDDFRADPQEFLRRLADSGHLDGNIGDLLDVLSSRDSAKRRYVDGDSH